MTDNLPPQDLDAERSVLGGVLLDNGAMHDVVDIVTAEDFYRRPHSVVFAAMLALSQRSEAIDTITLADELGTMGKLVEAGGVPYLASLDASVPSTSSLPRYAKIVADKAKLRRLIQTCVDIAAEAREGKSKAEEILDRAGAKMLDATQQRETKGILMLSELVPAVFREFQSRYEQQSEVTGVATGFVDFDKQTAGLQKQDLIIIAGRPSSGKTSVAMNIAINVARVAPVAVFSMEMSDDSIVARLFSSEARVDGSRIKSGMFIDSDWAKLGRAAESIYRLPLGIDETPAISLLELRAKCRRFLAKHGSIGLVVVDYLQLMRGSGNTDNRQEEISEISRGLKQIGKECDCSIIALSQLNRSLEKREDKRPMMSDLRESGAIEQDADLVVGVYRDSVYNPNTEDKNIAELIILKQRTGALGTVRVRFDGEFTRFDNLAREGRF